VPKTELEGAQRVHTTAKSILFLQLLYRVDSIRDKSFPISG